MGPRCSHIGLQGTPCPQLDAMIFNGIMIVAE